MNSTKRTCVTCTAKGVNKDEVPLWSKKDGLYSMLPKILNCEDTYNPEKQDLKEESPEIVGTNVEIPLEIKEKDRWVFYWAAEAGAALDGDKPEDPATSYGSESNRGLTKTDSDGNATLTLNCPKLYREAKQLYPRHVHYTVLTDEDVWSTKIGTLEIMCKLPLKTMQEIVKKKSYLIMNALSKESYDEKKIPNSIVCHHESLEKLTKQKKEGIIKQVIKENISDFPVVKEFVDTTESMKDVPIIVYCAHEECEASAKLAKHLYDCGYFNVMEYPGGLKEWFDDDKLFDDAPSDEEEVEGDEEEIDNEKDEEVIDLDTELDDDDEEIIVVDGIEYIHKDTEYHEIMLKDDMDVIGYYKGDNVEWISVNEWKEHKKRVKEKGGYKVLDSEDEDDEEDEVEEDDTAEDELEGLEEDTDVVNDDEGDDEDDKDKDEDEDEDEDEDDDKDYNKESLSSKKVSEIRNLLNKMNMSNKKLNNKHDMIKCLLKCKPLMKGGGKSDTMMYGGGIHQSTMNQQFRGWGFTFLQ